jgi:hypothetical protein
MCCGHCLALPLRNCLGFVELSEGDDEEELSEGDDEEAACGRGSLDGEYPFRINQPRPMEMWPKRSQRQRRGHNLKPSQSL